MTTTAETIDCPSCGEEIKAIAKKCKHCGDFIAPKAEATPETKPCPACGEDIKFIAKKCKHCGEVLGAVQSSYSNANSVPKVLHDNFIWGMVALPLFSLIDYGWVISLLGYIVLTLLDIKLLKSFNKKAPHFAWFLIPAVYIWRRLTLTEQKRTIFWSYLGCSVLSFILAVILAFGGSNIENQACDIINKQLRNESSDAFCSDVTITKSYGNDKYKAKATVEFTNGRTRTRTVRITIKNGMMYINK